jgi:hypothetical protein
LIRRENKMYETLLNILAVAYLSTGIIAVIGFWPTIKDLYHKKHSANITTYILWTFVSVIGVLYGLFILKDLLYIIVSMLNLIGCAIILFLAMRLKHKK